MNTLYTIGHSNRTIEEFLALLKAHNIQQIVDVRTIPKSKHNPQFGQDMLSTASGLLKSPGGMKKTSQSSRMKVIKSNFMKERLVMDYTTLLPEVKESQDQGQ